MFMCYYYSFIYLFIICVELIYLEYLENVRICLPVSGFIHLLQVFRTFKNSLMGFFLIAVVSFNSLIYD